MMQQEKFEIWMIDYLSDELEGKDRLNFEKYLEENDDHRKQFEALKETWLQLDEVAIPETSPKMDEQFFDMLHDKMESQNHKKESGLGWLQSLVGSIKKSQLAFAMLILGVGIGAGYVLNNDSNSDTTVNTVNAVVDTNTETEEVRGQLVLTLLEQASANKRLQGVNEAAKLNDANERVIEALFTTLNNDPNVNVRLVAVESLAKYVDTPEVRMGLVKSIGFQDSPLVQIALADLMVALQEKTSVESMKQLLEQPDIDNTVKQKLEESINHII